MTKDEAIELLEDLDGAIEDNHGRDYDEAFDMAIESLSAETVSREFYEDAIKANHGLAKENCELKAQIEPADMVKVVRCKDCRYKQYDVVHNFCEINYHKCHDDDYCAWGEKRK